MKKRTMILPMLVLAATAVGSLAGCSKPQPHRTGGTLAVCAYNGGYGIEWLTDICAKFEEETGIVTTCDSNSLILETIESELTGISNYDIYMSHGLAWQNFAERDLIADLDDLYSDTVDESGTKFIDRMSDDASRLSRYKTTTGEEHYYKVPFTQGVGGLVYNIDMFEENGWAVPETYDELVTLCDTIVKANKGVVPFAWTKDRDYYWDYIIFEWWAEMDGKATFDEWLELKGSDGTYKTGYESFDPSGKAKNFKKAYEMWFNLIAKHPEYSIKKAYNASLISAQNAFFNGKAAMIPYAQWAKNEIQQAMDGEFTFDIAMMKTPKVKKESAYHNFMVGYGDSMIVPKNSPNVDTAKEFLKFLSKEYACKKFVEKAEGPFFGFNYEGMDMSDLTVDPYIKSLYEILHDGVNVSLNSNNELIIVNGDTAIQPWVNNTRYYLNAASAPNDKNNSVDETFVKVFNSAKNSWPGWVRNLGY